MQQRLSRKPPSCRVERRGQLQRTVAGLACNLPEQLRDLTLIQPRAEAHVIGPVTRRVMLELLPQATTAAVFALHKSLQISVLRWSAHFAWSDLNSLTVLHLTSVHGMMNLWLRGVHLRIKLAAQPLNTAMASAACLAIFFPTEYVAQLLRRMLSDAVVCEC